MDWPIEPHGLADLLIDLTRDYAPRKVLVTENGAAFDDEVGPDGTIDDAERISFLRGHLLAAHEAIQAYVPLGGFFVWSLLDNFEWGHGYHQRFGLVHVDFQTQARTPKASARWYAEVARRRGVVS
jgi:beta-glucosidase